MLTFCENIYVIENLCLIAIVYKKLVWSTIIKL